jgi:RND family efflux transporter MFP subunit
MIGNFMPKHLLVLTVAAFGLAACEEEPVEFVEPVRAIKTVTVAERGSGTTRKFSGTVEATDTSSLSFEVAGNVTEVLADTGDQVKKGQILARLDTQTFELNVQGHEADLGRTKAVATEKALELQRQKTLFEKKWVSKAAYDQAVAANDTARNDVSLAQSRLSLAKRDLAKTVLVAPFDGLVALRLVDPFVEVGRGQALFEVFAEGALEIAINIPENTIDKINMGLPAEVSIPSVQGCGCTAIVSEIGSVTIEANSFPVKAALIERPVSVRPGMTAEIKFRIGGEEGENSFLIPISALAARVGPEDDISTKSDVFVFKPETGDPKLGTVVRRRVQVRGGTGDLVEIFDGLEAGEVVAVAGVSYLSDGRKVKLLNN